MELDYTYNIQLVIYVQFARTRAGMCVETRALQTLRTRELYIARRQSATTANRDRSPIVLLSECSQELPHQNVVHGVQGLQVRGQYNE